MPAAANEISIRTSVFLQCVAVTSELFPCALPAHPSTVSAGVVELCLAALWHFWLGVALGFGVAKMGTSLCGMMLAARPPPPPARGCLGWLKNLGRRALMWGAAKVQVSGTVCKCLRWGKLERSGA